MSILEAAQQIGLKPRYVAATEGGEYHSACPECGGKDRLRLHPNRIVKYCVGSYRCRQCNIYGDYIQFCRDYLGCTTFEEAVTTANGTLAITKKKAAMNKKNTTIPQRIVQHIPSHHNEPIVVSKTSAEWVQQADIVVQEGHANLLQQPDVLAWLERRGIPLTAVITYKLGWLSKDIRHDGKLWGLEKGVLLPAGLLIPIIGKNGSVKRLKIRCKSWSESSPYAKYIAISGNMSGLNIIGDLTHDVVIVVESELDAYAIHHVVGDFTCIVAIGGSVKLPDNVSDHIAKKARILLICHDNDDAGKKMLEKWRKLYLHAKGYPTPYGKDIGEAISSGLDIREFFLSAIDTVNMAQQSNTNVKSVQASPRIPVICTTTPPTVIPQQSALVAIADEVPQVGDDIHDNAPSISTAPPPNPIEKVNSEHEYTESHSDVSNAEWPPQDRELITWTQRYFQAIPEHTKLPSDKSLLKEIEQGPTSERAQSGALQKELRWIRRLVSGKIL
jgi:DNA primase